MRRALALLFAGALVGALLTVATSAATKSKWPADCTTFACVNKHLNALEEHLQLRPLKTGWVGLNDANLDPGGRRVLTAFVATGSRSPRCLVTFNESSAATTMVNVFCGRRTVDGVQGVIVRAFLETDLPPEGDFQLTVWQAGAESYGDPVPCPFPCGE